MENDKRMQRWAIGLLFVVALLSPLFSAAAPIGDVGKGHAYAQKFCADCHPVERDESIFFSDVPSFQEVADAEAVTGQTLAVWLRTSHPNMPNFIIAPGDLENVIAYILSLKTPE